MLNTIFKSVIDSQTGINVPSFLLCLAVSLVIGVYFAFMYSFKSRYTKSFVVTLALLPTIVCTVIMMVNGNIGAGVAVAGTFSLVRFRSVPGTAKEIGAIFMAMGAGLVTGMGYLGYAILFSIIVGLALFIFNNTNISVKEKEKSLKITIPEDLDYYSVFDDIFTKYTTSSELISSKTTNMGSMFKLNYNITLKDPSKEKEFVDELRCRNGNLEIAIGRQVTNIQEL